MGDRDRVVAAEMRFIVARAIHESSLVARIAEPPNYAAIAPFKFPAADDGGPVDKIGHRVVPIDGKARSGIGDDPLGGGCYGRNDPDPTGSIGRKCEPRPENRRSARRQ